jgi:hypothetical protein
MAYTLADPAHVLHVIQRELTPFNGLTGTLYIPEKIKGFLGETHPPGARLGNQRRKPPGEAPNGLAKVADFLGKAQLAFDEYLQETAEE